MIQNNAPHELGGIKYLKFLQVLFMLVSHGMIWAISGDDEIWVSSNNPLYELISTYPSISYFQLTLPMTAGVLLRYTFDPYMIDQRLSNFSLHSIFPTLITLVIAESVINIITFGWNAALDWDVLKFLCVSFLLLVMLLRVGLFTLLPLSIAVILVTPAVTSWFADSNNYLTGILIGDGGRRFFWPIFPWFGTVVLGFLLCHTYIRVQNKGAFRALCAITGVVVYVGSDFIADGRMTLDPNPVWERIFQPESMIFVGFIGFYVALFAATTQWGLRHRPSRYGMVDCYAQGMLWIYGAHIVIGFPASRLIQTRFSDNLVSAVALFVLSLTLLSWFVGFLSIRLLKEKRFLIRLQGR